MRAAVLTLLLSLTLVGVPSSEATASAGPAGSRPAGAAVQAAGTFDATVDFSTLTTQDVAGGRHCILTLDGALTFRGTAQGVADGTTTAYVLAPCADVLSTPPGTHADVFRFSGTFTGSIAGTATAGPALYTGVTRPGGEIDAAIVLRGPAGAVLRADATVAVGGSYTGIARRH